MADEQGELLLAHRHVRLADDEFGQSLFLFGDMLTEAFQFGRGVG